MIDHAAMLLCSLDFYIAKLPSNLGGHCHGVHYELKVAFAVATSTDIIHACAQSAMDHMHPGQPGQVSIACI